LAEFRWLRHRRANQARNRPAPFPAKRGGSLLADTCGGWMILCLPQITSGHIDDAVRPGSGGRRYSRPSQRRAISARPCSMTNECACRCNSPCTTAARGAVGVQPTICWRPIQRAAKHDITSLVDGLVNANSATKPGMMPINREERPVGGSQTSLYNYDRTIIGQRCAVQPTPTFSHPPARSYL